MMREMIRINANILWIDYNEKENPPLHISISTSHDIMHAWKIE